jgi:hypothetical protein
MEQTEVGIDGNAQARATWDGVVGLEGLKALCAVGGGWSWHTDVGLEE